MLTTKTFEVRDNMTTIPVMVTQIGIDLDARDRGICARGGFYGTGLPYYIMTSLTSMETHHDPVKWSNKTMRWVHWHLYQFWKTFENGAVIDVEFIQGITTQPKKAECY